MSTRVHLTVDTEFSIAGAFADPVRNRPVGPAAVYCPIGGQSAGLGYLLDTLATHGLKATFFVETLNTFHFGDGPMGEIAARIHAAGHDVQLHMHPCWAYFRQPDWAAQLERNPPNDDITRRSEDEIVELIEYSCEVFTRWGLPAPRVLRTGALKVNMAVYRAMERCGLALASNLGLALYRPRETELQLYAGRHRIGAVTELPVTTYRDLALPGRTRYKTLTITGTSWPEMRGVLERARAAGLDDVVVLTHAFEYVKHRDITYETLYPDRVNRARLAKLCAFLAQSPDFDASLFSDEAPSEPAPNPLLGVPPLHAAGRMLVNRINHSFMRL